MALLIPILFREKEIEEKISKLDVKDEPEKTAGGAYRPPGARGERDDRLAVLFGLTSRGMGAINLNFLRG